MDEGELRCSPASWPGRSSGDDEQRRKPSPQPRPGPTGWPASARSARVLDRLFHGPAAASGEADLHRPMDRCRRPRIDSRTNPNDWRWRLCRKRTRSYSTTGWFSRPPEGIELSWRSKVRPSTGSNGKRTSAWTTEQPDGSGRLAEGRDSARVRRKVAGSTAAPPGGTGRRSVLLLRARSGGALATS